MAATVVAAICILKPAIANPSIDDLVGTIAGSDVVILGEVHDNPHHHRLQAALIERLGPTVVVFEMLTDVQAERVNASSDRGAGLGVALNWSESGWPDWELYEPVFLATGSAPVSGMALPREDVRRAVSEGAAAVFDGDPERFGLNDALPSEMQTAREKLQFEAHCEAMPADMLPGMVEAQRLRDAAFARTTLSALDRHGAPVVVIAGTGHARKDWGMPAALRSAAPDVTVFALGQFEADPSIPEQFDGVIVADPADRADPCAAFD